MMNYNKEMANRVWQRVQAAQPSQSLPNPQETLLQLIEWEWLTADCYGRITPRLSGQAAAIGKTLHSQKKEQVSCLKGLYILLTGVAPTVPAKPIAPEPVHAMLRRCYGLQMRCLAHYETKAQDAEHGVVYARLAAQNKEQCHKILALLGEKR